MGFPYRFSVSNNTCRQAPQGGIGVSRKSFSVRAAMASVLLLDPDIENWRKTKWYVLHKDQMGRLHFLDWFR